MKLTDKQQWFIHFLREKEGQFILPTECGRVYKNETGKGSGHSSSASPTLLQLVRIGCVERNEKGHYKYKRV